jgi:hypothetical protein
LVLAESGKRGDLKFYAKYFDEYMKPQVPSLAEYHQGGTNDYRKIGFMAGTRTYRYGPGIYGFHWYSTERGGYTPDAITLAPRSRYGDVSVARGNALALLPSANLIVVPRAEGRLGGGESRTQDSKMNCHFQTLLRALGRKSGE